MVSQMLHPDYQYYFYLRKSKTAKKDRVPVYLRLIHLGVRKDVSTRIYVPEKYWIKDCYRVSNAASGAEEINHRLFQLESDIKEALKHLLRTKDYFSVEDLWAYAQGERATTGVLAYFKETIEKNKGRLGTSLSPNTQKVYKSTLRHLETFIKERIKGTDINLKALTIAHIEDFRNYLLTHCNRNTANKYLKTLRAVLNTAIKDELLYKNPFKYVRLSAGQYDRSFLDQEELNRLLEVKLTIPALRLAQEFMVVSCFTGMHYSDIVSLKPENIVEKNGRTFISKKRVKTEQPFLVPLFPQVKKIIDRHAAITDGEYLFSFYSNQKTNENLKKVALLCGIKQRLTCKMGRHTFGTTVTLQNNVPIESVSRMMGHSKISTTQIYARVLEGKLAKDMEDVMLKYA